MIGTLWLEFIDGTNCTHQVVYGVPMNTFFQFITDRQRHMGIRMSEVKQYRFTPMEGGSKDGYVYVAGT